MLFSSITFFLFFLPYLLAHRITPPRYRNYIIILGSLIFYAWWRPQHVWVPIILIVIAFIGSKAITKLHGRTKKLALLSSLIALCTPLLIFKYSSFIGETLANLIQISYPSTSTQQPIPLAISFITFTLIAFIVDTYKGRIKYRIGPASFASYILFFPQLIAGPILRPDELIPQLTRPKPSRWRLRSVLVAVGIFTLGLTKKIIFADQLAAVVDPIFQGASQPLFEEALLALYGFAVQIYCDFSGYIDMATGIALILGVRLPINFKQPYASINLADFWRRWHITLSNWLRDYLYIPLGGSRHGQTVQSRNLLMTMAIGGIWHGANWTFIMWGLIQGLGLVVSHQFKRIFNTPKRLQKFIQIFLTFHFICLTWILFRSGSIQESVLFYKGLLSFGEVSGTALASFAEANIFYIALILFFLFTHHFDDHRRIALLMRKGKTEIIIPSILLLIILCTAMSQGSSGAFIYFEF